MGLVGRVWYQDMKARRIRHNLSADTHVFVSLSLRANRQTSFGPRPVSVLLGVGREGPRRWSYESSVVLSYCLKVSHIRHNLSAEADTLSRSVYESIAMQVLRGSPSPSFEGEGVELEGQGRVWCHIKARAVESHTLSIAPIMSKTAGKFWGWGADPQKCQIWERGLVRVGKIGPIER